MADRIVVGHRGPGTDKLWNTCVQQHAPYGGFLRRNLLTDIESVYYMESGYIVVCNASVTVVPVPFYEYGVGLQGTVGPTGSPDAWSLIFLVFLRRRR